MARAKTPGRDKAKDIWLDSGGTASTKELAAAVGVPEARIRKWRSLDKWRDELDLKKRGGQRGNTNAAGHGAPKGNANAETHGAYSRVHLDSLPPDERAYIEALELDAESAMLREFQLLMAKERDLTRRIAAYAGADPAALYVDRVVEMLVPRGNERLTNSRKKLESLQIERDNLAWEIESAPRRSDAAIKKLDKLDLEIAVLSDKVSDKAQDAEDVGPLKITMKTVMKSSPFERIMKLEAEYNKLHGRLLKLIDTMRAHGIDIKRLDLDERKHTLAKQRLSGEYEIDPETGDILDTEGADESDIE